jgi:hypothetical protein
MTLRVVPIVEGHGEVAAVPVLVQRLCAAAGRPVTVNPPIRVRVRSFLQEGREFERYIALAVEKARAVPAGLVLILLDGDLEGDLGCPARLGPGLLARARAVRPDGTFLVAIAVREYEAWLLAGIESLAGLHGVAQDARCPDNFEAIRDAKGWLKSCMAGRYDPIEHQAKLTKALDLDAASRSASFRRLRDRLRAAAEAG